jgi:signal transduction histidine kinase
LRWYVERVAERSGIEGTVAIDDEERRFLPDIETTAFRMAQEALTNVVRHAQASHVWVGVWHTAHELELVIRDDGIGFDVPAARERAVRGESLGLLGMQERVELAGGVLEITSTPGRGTEVRAHLPHVPAQQRGKRGGMGSE